MRAPESKTAVPRRSRSAAQSRALEQARIDRMSVEERIKAALTLDTRFAWLTPKRRGAGP